MVRKSRQLAQKKVIAIYCEGESEVAYFRMLNQKYGGANVYTERVRIEQVQTDRGLKMLKKVRRRADRLSQTRQLDQTYVCFDRDNISRAELEQCGKYARQNKLRLIFSSINFEIWILMHFEAVNRAYTAMQLVRRLSGPQYFNQDYQRFKGHTYHDFLLDDVKTAVRHARLLMQQRGDQWLTADPYTNVHQWLTDIYGVTQY